MFCLNDASEAKYGYGLLESFVANDMAENMKKFMDGLPQRLDQSFGHAFVSCFCRKGNLLSQWRNYGQGVAIGFDVKGLNTEFGNLSNVVYGPKNQNKLIVLAIESLFEHYDASDDEFGLACQDELVFLLSFLLPRLKHPDFLQEDEWRIIFRKYFNHNLLDDPCVLFRESSTMLIPYLSLKPKSKKLPITDIKIGPSMHSNGLIRTFKILLQTNGYDPDMVSWSQTPARL